MKNRFLYIGLILAVAAVVVPVGLSHAELDEGPYMIETDNNDSTILIEIDADGKHILTDLFVTVGNKDIIVAESNIQRIRDYSDGTHKIFGETNSGDHFYLIYSISNEEDVKLLLKVWTEEKTYKIIDSGHIESIF